MYLSEKKVKPLNDYNLELTFENNEIKIFDAKPQSGLRPTVFLQHILGRGRVPSVPSFTLPCYMFQNNFVKIDAMITSNKP